MYFNMPTFEQLFQHNLPTFVSPSIHGMPTVLHIYILWRKVGKIFIDKDHVALAEAI